MMLDKSGEVLNVCIASKISEKYFYVAAHRKIFAAILELFNEQKPVDEILVSDKLEAMGVWELIGLWLESNIIHLCMWILSIVIFVIVYGRMIEIYLTVSLAPIPFSTMANREWGQIGTNYLRSIFALAFQGFLILVCVAIYAVLVQTIPSSDDIHGAIWGTAGYTVLLAFALFKTGSLSKSIFSAH